MEKGTRVGCVLSSNEEQVNFLGYGTYEGEEIPSKDAGGLGPILNVMGRKNPKIKLDNGKIVWGCECWWGEKNELHDKILSGKKIIKVDIDDARRGVESC